MDYTPQQPTQPPAPQPTYSLLTDVTGKPPEKRGPQVMIATRYVEDKETKVQFKVPYPPKKNCKRCYGRGYTGFNVSTGNPMGCEKCYPTR